MPVETNIFYNSNESKLLNIPKYFVVPTLGVWCETVSDSEGAQSKSAPLPDLHQRCKARKQRVHSSGAFAGQARRLGFLGSMTEPGYLMGYLKRKTSTALDLLRCTGTRYRYCTVCIYRMYYTCTPRVPATGLFCQAAYIGTV